MLAILVGLMKRSHSAGFRKIQEGDRSGERKARKRKERVRRNALYRKNNDSIINETRRLANERAE